MNLKPWVRYYILILFVITLTFFVLSFVIDNNAIEIIAVTMVTLFYHSCIRPMTGTLIDMKYHNNMNFNLWWFRERKFEKHLFKMLKVKRWKNIIPTYDKVAFDIRNKNIEQVLGATCQAEIVHEIMFILAFVPLLLIIPYGQAAIFIISSILCAIIDLICIIVQRFNRTRLIKFYSKYLKNNIKKD